MPQHFASLCKPTHYSMITRSRIPASRGDLTSALTSSILWGAGRDLTLACAVARITVYSFGNDGGPRPVWMSFAGVLIHLILVASVLWHLISRRIHLAVALD